MTPTKRFGKYENSPVIIVMAFLCKAFTLWDVSCMSDISSGKNLKLSFDHRNQKLIWVTYSVYTKFFNFISLSQSQITSSSSSLTFSFLFTLETFKLFKRLEKKITINPSTMLYLPHSAAGDLTISDSLTEILTLFTPLRWFFNSSDSLTLELVLYHIFNMEDLINSFCSLLLILYIFNKNILRFESIIFLCH